MTAPLVILISIAALCAIVAAFIPPRRKCPHCGSRNTAEIFPGKTGIHFCYSCRRKFDIDLPRE